MIAETRSHIFRWRSRFRRRRVCLSSLMRPARVKVRKKEKQQNCRGRARLKCHAENFPIQLA